MTHVVKNSLLILLLSVRVRDDGTTLFKWLMSAAWKRPDLTMMLPPLIAKRPPFLLS